MQPTYFRRDVDNLRVVAYLLRVGEIPPIGLVERLCVLGWLALNGPEGQYALATRALQMLEREAGG